MRFVIVTGMSGAGHSSAMRILEDAGYFCVDNLPVNLLSTFMQLTVDSSEEIERVALGIDVRVGQEASISTCNLASSSIFVFITISTNNLCITFNFSIN